VGKTSFSNVLLEDHPRKAMHTCSSTDDFISIYNSILTSIGGQFTKSEIKQLNKISATLGEKNVASITGEGSEETTIKPVVAQSLDLSFLIDRLRARKKDLDVIIIEEFQNLEDFGARKGVLEVIKTLADRRVGVTTIVVGAARSDDDLFAGASQYNDYKLRYFSAYRIPPMTTAELEDIINLRKNLFNVKV